MTTFIRRYRFASLFYTRFHSCRVLRLELFRWKYRVEWCWRFSASRIQAETWPQSLARVDEAERAA